MKKILICLLLLLLGGVLCGCEGEEPAEKNAPERKAQATDKREGERSEEMPEYCSILDGKLRILLDANATTGYQWTCFISDENVLICEQESYVPDGVEEGLCGAGGIYVADLLPKADGTVTVKFTYGRPWENGFAKRMFIDITVQDGTIKSVKENTDCK